MQAASLLAVFTLIDISCVTVQCTECDA